MSLMYLMEMGHGMIPDMIHAPKLFDIYLQCKHSLITRASEAILLVLLVTNLDTIIVQSVVASNASVRLFIGIVYICAFVLEERKITVLYDFFSFIFMQFITCIQFASNFNVNLSKINKVYYLINLYRFFFQNLRFQIYV